MKMIYVAISLMTVTVCASMCPNLSVVQDFDLEKYDGLWYQQSAWGVILLLDACCVTANYTLNSTTGKLDILNEGKLFLYEYHFQQSGFAVLDNSYSLEAKLKVTLNFWTGQRTGYLWVLATDYDSYSIIHYCKEELNHTVELAWILSRNQTLSEDTEKKIETALYEIEKNGGPSISGFKTTSQENC